MAEKLVAGLGTVKKIVQDVVTPGFNDLKTEVRVVGTKVEEMDKRINEKIDSNSLRLEQKIDLTSRRLEEKIDGIAEKMDIIKTMTRLEMRVSELEKRP